MNKKTFRITFCFFGMLVLAVILGLVFPKNTDVQTTGLTKVPGYVNDAPCAAMSPSCGLCYGQIIGKECYINKTKLTPEQLHYMGF